MKYGIPGTILNDINASNFMALEYKDPNGLWQGTVGKYLPFSEKTSYMGGSFL
ncbi:MAG: hypothetical protein ACI8SE_001179 [Bacteroidia bacterium]